MKQNRSALIALAMAAPVLLLGGCGGKSDGNSASAALNGPIVGKAAPAGAKWSDQVVATPEGGFRMGNPDAPIKLVEYGSFTCSHCRDFAEESEEPLKRDYVDTGKVNFEYRFYVRDPIDITVAMLARCAGPEPFFPLAAQFFGNQEAMFKQLQSLGDAGYQSAVGAPAAERFVKLAELANLIDFAKQRGLPEDKARVCLGDVKGAEALASGVDTANQKYQIQGTPTIILNGSVLENVTTWPSLQARLKELGV